jgi:hypothetical protein
MAYGTVKVDNITFTNGGIDQTVTVSGIVQSISGNITATGTIQGQTIIGTSTVSGATVTGDAGQFTTATAATGIFTSQISGATITGNVGSFTTITGGTVTLTSGVFASGTAAAPSVSIGTTDNGLYSPGADQVAVATNGTGRLFVDASGNVGVGTSSVNALLEVNNSTAGGEVQRIEGNYDGSGSVTLTNWRRAGGSVAAALKYNDDSSPLCMSIGTTTSHEFRIRTADTDAITIDASQRVGIGTSSPAYKLDVVVASSKGIGAFAPASSAGITDFSAGGVGWTFTRPDDGSYIHSIYSYNTAAAAKNNFVIQSRNDIVFTYGGDHTNAIETMRLADGKVGIGTTSPGEELQIGATTSASSTSPVTLSLGGQYTPQASISLSNLKLKVYDSGTDSAGLTGGQDGLSYVAAKNGQHIWYRADGAGTLFESFRSDTSGRLLVGTSSSPGAGNGQYAKVVVQGYVGGTPGGALISLQRDEAPAAITTGETLGVLSFGANDGSTFAEISGVADGTAGASDFPGRLVFSTTADGASSPTERLRITSAGLVGIGTTTPISKLEVDGDIRSAGRGTSFGFILPDWRVYNSSGGNALVIDNYTTEALRVDSSNRLLVGTSSVISNGYGGTSGLFQVAKNDFVPIGFFTYTSAGADGYCPYLELNRARGTQASPSAVLSGDELGEINFYGHDGSTFIRGASIRSYVDGTPGAGDMPGRLVFSTTADGASSPTERMRITSAGLVGIGTSSPGAQLHVVGSSILAGNVSVGTTASATSLQFPAVTGWGPRIQQGGASINDFGIFTNNTENLTVKNSGNVGIGTTSPNQLLQINSTSVDARLHITNSVTGSTNSDGFQIQVNNSDVFFHLQEAGDIYFQSNSSTRAIIDSSGRLLVGTSTQQGDHYLQVQGSATASSYPGSIFLRRGLANASIGDGNQLGVIDFGNQDGGKGATISAEGDAAWGTNDYPGRLVFSTTADGASAPTERLRITSAGLVGIGTSSPGGKLDVRDAGTTIPALGAVGTGLNVRRTDGAIGLIIGYENAVGGSYIQAQHTNGSAAAYPLYLQPNGGNVGIGTTAPNEKLTVADSGSANVYIALQNSTTGTTSADGWYLGAAGTEFQIYGKENGPITFSPNSTERARIDSSGRLLVGTSAARSSFGLTPNLQVEGTGYDGGSVNLIVNNNSNGVTSSFINLCRSRGTTNGSTTVVQADDSLGAIAWCGADGSDLTSCAATIRAFVDGTPGAGDMPGRLVFSTTADGASSPTGRAQIDNAGRFYTFVAAATDGPAFMSAEGAGTVYQLFAGWRSTSTVSGASAQLVFQVFTNGNTQNTNNSYAGISDLKLKENVVDAGSQWSDIKELRVRKYNFKEKTGHETHTQIGLIAQEAELVSPGLVIESPDRNAEGKILGTITKSVNYSVLYMKAVKALQEAMERIENLEASNADLLARVSALESA